ncbi:MAG: TldD/PmbA family protein [Candidatus Nitrosocaldaceae archaeon]
MEADEIVSILHVDEAEVYKIEKEILTVRIADKHVIETKGIRDDGVAIRIVKDKRINGIKISSDKTSLRDIDIKGERHEEWKGLPATSNVKPFNGYDKALDDLSIEDYLEISKSMLNHANKFKLDNFSGSIHLIKERVELTNSNGVNLNDKATYILTNINADKDNVSGVGFSSSRTLNRFDYLDAVEYASQMAIRSLNAKRCDEDYYSIIFEPYALAELLSFVFAYNFNSKMYREKRSCLYNRLDEQIASEILTVYDDGRIEDGLGSKAFDDEGLETKRTPLIEDGIFKNIIYDTFYACKDSRESTANGLRVGYPVGRASEPSITPSMHNIVIKEGEYSKEEMIKDTRKGLLVGRLWYTYPVNPEQGDFSCTARSGIFLIENGEIKHPCKMVRIIDNLKRFMLNISAISKERKQVLQWHAIPCVASYIKVDKIRAIPI